MAGKHPINDVIPVARPEMDVKLFPGGERNIDDVFVFLQAFYQIHCTFQGVIDFGPIKNALAGKSFSLKLGNINGSIHLAESSQFVIDYQTILEQDESEISH